MAGFVYNNAKNGSTSNISFKLNCGYYQILYKEKVNSRFNSKSIDE